MHKHTKLPQNTCLKLTAQHDRLSCKFIDEKCTKSVDDLGLINFFYS